MGQKNPRPASGRAARELCSPTPAGGSERANSVHCCPPPTGVGRILGVVTLSRRSENGEWGKRGANIIASPWKKVWHPFVAFSENGEWRMIGEKHEACNETFSENSPFFTRGGEEVRFSILQGWALHHSRRGCHFTILRPPRMGGKRCDNPYCHHLFP